jgi:hypothetical protein
VRVFDRNFLKPLLLREKFVSKDDKLLNTFKKINEANATKIAEDPHYVLPSSTSVANLRNKKFNSSSGELAGYLICGLIVFM